jgi:hypothetical protein
LFAFPIIFKQLFITFQHLLVIRGFTTLRRLLLTWILSTRHTRRNDRAKGVAMLQHLGLLAPFTPDTLLTG